MTTEPETPEHDKFRPHQEDARTIGEFLEWMSSEGIRRMRWGEEIYDTDCPNAHPVYESQICVKGILHRFHSFRPEPIGELIGQCPACDGTGYLERTREAYIPDRRSIEQLIADFFGIDKKKFDEETEAVYQYVSAIANPKL